MNIKQIEHSTIKIGLFCYDIAYMLSTHVNITPANK